MPDFHLMLGCGIGCSWWRYHRLGFFMLICRIVDFLLSLFSAVLVLFRSATVSSRIWNLRIESAVTMEADLARCTQCHYACGVLQTTQVIAAQTLRHKLKRRTAQEGSFLLVADKKVIIIKIEYLHFVLIINNG